MNRGDVCWYLFQAPDKRRPVLILTRDSALGFLNSVTIAPIMTASIPIPPTRSATSSGLIARCVGTMIGRFVARRILR